MVNNGVHTVGVPEQPVWPAASYTATVPPCVGTYTMPLTTAGDPEIAAPALAFQSGVHVIGAPLQCWVPVASNAYTVLLRVPTYRTPPSTAAGPGWLSSAADQSGWQMSSSVLHRVGDSIASNANHFESED